MRRDILHQGPDYENTSERWKTIKVLLQVDDYKFVKKEGVIGCIPSLERF
jgi:hypothetical protein